MQLNNLDIFNFGFGKLERLLASSLGHIPANKFD